jgi:hypothetical protein
MKPSARWWWFSDANVQVEKSAHWIRQISPSLLPHVSNRLIPDGLEWDLTLEAFKNPTKVSGTAHAHWGVSYCWQRQATWRQKDNSLLRFDDNVFNFYIVESDMCSTTMHRENLCCISTGTCLVKFASCIVAEILQVTRICQTVILYYLAYLVMWYCTISKVSYN